MNVASGEMRKVSENRQGIGMMAWSPDGRWLAYQMSAPNSFQQLKLFSVESGRSVALTTDRTNSFAPAWDPKGEFIYFLSDRNLRTLVGAPWGNRRPEPYFDKEIEVYQVALRPGLRSPFLPDDELKRPSAATPSTPAAAPGASPAARGDSGLRPVVIELEGLPLHIRRVPLPSGNYGALFANGEALFVTSRGSGADAKTDLVALKIGNEKPEGIVVVDDIRSVELSGNGKKLLVRKGNALHVIDARAAKVATLADARLDLGGWSFDIDVRDDFRQLFVDAWRLERDWFYDPNLHGVDYQATLDKYAPLVQRITTRAELSDLIGWAVGELSALHTSVGGGALRRGEDQVQVASLGARLFRDPAKGGYRIDYIYRNDPEYPAERSPLADPELGVKAGDVITAVNGQGTLEARDVGELLRNQVGKQVLLSLATAGGSREVVVEPIGNEQNLRYTDWEYTRRLATEQKGDNRIGYVHLRAMGDGDINQFYREFTPLVDKQGLILDMRHNRGGNIDSWVLEMLMRKPWMYWQDRVGEPYWNMQGAFRGHMVMLVDQETASDGEAVAEGFRRLGLGVVIGTRTWGGEIWLSGANTLSDGGIARAPMSGVYGPEGKWLIEQEGVIPDLVVDNLPHAHVQRRGRAARRRHRLPQAEDCRRPARGTQAAAISQQVAEDRAVALTPRTASSRSAAAARGRPSRRGRPRSGPRATISIAASTTCHTSKAYCATRSVAPSQGVGWLRSSAEAYENAATADTSMSTTVTTEYVRNRPGKATIARTRERSTKGLVARIRCIVSVNDRSAPRMCMGKAFQISKPMTADPANITASARTTRRSPAARHTPSEKTRRSTLQRLNSATAIRLVGAPMAKSSLTAWPRKL